MAKRTRAMLIIYTYVYVDILVHIYVCTRRASIASGTRGARTLYTHTGARLSGYIHTSAVRICPLCVSLSLSLSLSLSRRTPGVSVAFQKPTFRLLSLSLLRSFRSLSLSLSPLNEQELRVCICARWRRIRAVFFLLFWIIFFLVRVRERERLEKARRWVFAG